MESPAVPYPKAVARFPTVRQSRLSAFDACALEAHFEMSYRRGWNEHHQARGQIFHKVASRCLEEMRAQGETEISVDVALAILDEVLGQDDVDAQCPECHSERILPGISRYMERTCGDCGRLFESDFVNVPRREIKDLVMVTKKWAHDNRFDTPYIVSIEERLTVPVHYSLKGVTCERLLTGKLDVLVSDRADAAHAIVIDWKDTWQLPAKSEISESGYFQQRFYAWLVMKTYKTIDRVTLREFYVRKSQRREAMLFRHDLGQLDAEFSALVRKFDRAIEHQVFVPSPGKHCGWCLRPSKCPVPVFARGDGRITTEKRAKEVAAQLIVAERIVKGSKDALKAWVGEHGPVEVKDAKGKRIYGFRDGPRTDKPSQREIEQAMLAAGGALGDAEVAALFTHSVQSTFTSHAPPVPEEAEDRPLIDALAASLDRAMRRKGVK